MWYDCKCVLFWECPRSIENVPSLSVKKYCKSINRLGSRFWNLFLESTRWRRRLFSGNKIKTISWHWWSTEWLCHFVVKLRPKQSQKYEHRNWNTNKFFTGYKHRLQNSKWKTDFTMELIKWKDQPQSKERILFLVKPFISLAFILNSNVSNQH